MPSPIVLRRALLGKSAPSPTIQLSGLSVDEDASTGTVIGALSTVSTPVDWGTSNYTITSDPDSKFDINAGNLVTAAALDYETATSHQVQITDTPSGPYDPITRTFTIAVGDVEEVDVPITDNQTLDYGALTKEDMLGYLIPHTGGDPVSGTITGGDSGGHWKIIVSGTEAYLSPTATGDTADLNGTYSAVTYTLTNAAGTSVEKSLAITCSGNNADGRDLANSYSLASDADVSAVLALEEAIDGKNILFRPGSYSNIAISTSGWGGLWTTATLWSSHDKSTPATVDGFVLTNVEHMTIDGLYLLNSSITNNIEGIVEMSGCDNIVINENEITTANTPSASARAIYVSDTVGVLSITDNYIHDVYQGCIITDCTDNLAFTGNLVFQHFFDAFFIRRTTSAGTTTTVSQNTFDTCLNTGEGHADAIQYLGQDATEPIEGWIVEENLFRYDVEPAVQLIYCEAVAAYPYVDAQINRNAGMTPTSHAANLAYVDGGRMSNNTFVHPGLSVGNNLQPYIWAGTVGVTNPMIVTGNISEGVYADGNNIVDIANIKLSLRGAAVDYNDVMDGPWTTSAPTSRAAMLAAMSMKAGGPADQDSSGGPSVGDSGAIGSGAFTPPTSSPGTAGIARDTSYETYWSTIGSPIGGLLLTLTKATL